MSDLKIIQKNKVVKVKAVEGAVYRKGYSPYIGSDGFWYEYNDLEKTFVSTGVKAQGEDGYTPIKGTDYFTAAEVENVVNEATPEVSVMGIVEDRKVVAHQVYFRDHNGNQLSSFTVSEGRDGASPDIEASTITNPDGTKKHRVIIHNTDGTDSTFEVKDGVNGIDGLPGVYVGDTEPTDPNIKVWIDTSDGPDPVTELIENVLAERLKEKEWVLKGTLQGNETDRGNIDSGVNVDLSGCTELYIGGYVYGTGASNLTSNVSTIIDSFAQANNYRVWVAQFADNFKGMQCLTSKYRGSNAGVPNRFAYGNGAGCSYFDGTMVKDFNQIRFSGSSAVIECNIEIWAR